MNRDSYGLLLVTDVDNIYPLFSSPMIDFNIEPYETKSVDRKFLYIDTMLKA